MTDHLRTDPSDLASRPLISTVARGGAMTRIVPGRPVARVDGRLLALLTASGTAWAAAGSVPWVALLGLAPTDDVERTLGGPWATAAAILLAGIAIAVTLRLRANARQTFGQARVTHLVSSVAITSGLAASSAGWFVAGLRFDPAPWDLDHLTTSTTVPRELGALVGLLFAAWSVMTIVLLVITVRRARSQQHLVDRLHHDGDRFDGVLEAIHFRQSWLRDEPEFTIEVSYTGHDGPRRVTANLLTDASQVPVVGNPMIVLSDGRGGIHVDLDHARGVVYLDDHTRYAAPRD